MHNTYGTASVSDRSAIFFTGKGAVAAAVDPRPLTLPPAWADQKEEAVE